MKKKAGESAKTTRNRGGVPNVVAIRFSDEEDRLLTEAIARLNVSRSRFLRIAIMEGFAAAEQYFTQAKEVSK